MSIWNVAPVDVRPEIELIRWRILETDAGTRHFVGCETLDHSGRASTAIEQFDAGRRRGVTRSGRVYQLLGPCGFSPDAEYVWNRWCTVNSVKTYYDVTLDVVPGANDESA